MTTAAQRSAVLGADSEVVQANDDEATAETTDDEPDMFETSVNASMNKDERKALKNAEKVRKKAEGKRKKLKEKRKKAQQKAKREEEKRAKKEAKRRKKLGLPPEEDDEEEDRGAPSDDVIARQWIDSGVTLQVTFRFERYQLTTPRMGFLADFEVSYSHKESNCGVEGWLECSEDGGPFKRRFVYLQDKGTGNKPGHSGSIKMIANADNGN